jgi:hypothetical protein
VSLAVRPWVGKAWLLRILFGLVSVMPAVTGCSNLHGSSAQLEEDARVSARVSSYWNALIARDWAKAYQHATPGYRATNDEFSYRRKHDGFVRYLKAEILEVACEQADSCKVKLRLHVKIMLEGGADPVDTVTEERWLRESGEWYRHFGT